MPQLPPIIRAYFDAKNWQDVDAMLTSFADAAVVHDEGEEHRGRISIRDWLAETTRKYRVTVQPTETETQGDALVVSALVTGNFPGSPVTLRYRFTLADDRIVTLAVG